MFARKIRCFENVCSLYSLSAQKKPTLLAKGAAGGGGGAEAGGWEPVQPQGRIQRGARPAADWFPGSPFWQLQRLWMPHPLAP